MSGNVPASIRQRLLNESRKQDLPFDAILKLFGVERLLYRLSKSEYANQFILKGAQLLRAWNASSFRPTQDVDFLGFTENTVENLIQIVKELCQMSVEVADGIVFDPESVSATRIKEDADYQGVRVMLSAQLDSAKIVIQMDVGFNDVITPEPLALAFPTFLDLPAPHLRGYTPETVIAEKVEAMVILGQRNSRMKDFYDILLLSRTQSFSNRTLREAVEKTFAQRETDLPSELPILLSEDHPVVEQKQIQWAAFRRKNQLTDAPDSFQEVTGAIRDFVEPFLMGGKPMTEMKWTLKEGWVTA